MNREQRQLVFVAGLAIVLAGLFPPWLVVHQSGETTAAGFRFVFDPTDGLLGLWDAAMKTPLPADAIGYRLDVLRLLACWGTLLLAAGTYSLSRWLSVSAGGCPEPAADRARPSPESGPGSRRDASRSSASAPVEPPVPA